MQEARQLISETIRELRRVWQIELPEQGLDYTDFFTYEGRSERPEWMRRKGVDQAEITPGLTRSRSGVKPTNKG